MMIIDLYAQAGLHGDFLKAKLNGLFIIAFGIGKLFFDLHKIRKKNQIENLPTTKVKHASQGLTQLQGVAWPIKHQVSLLGHPIVYYSLKYQERSKLGDKNDWVTLKSFTSNNNFILMDSSGYALVNIASKADQSHDFMLDEILVYLDDLNVKSREIASQYIPDIFNHISATPESKFKG